MKEKEITTVKVEPMKLAELFFLCSWEVDWHGIQDREQ